MADIANLSVKELRELADDIQAQAYAMRIKSERTFRVYLVLGLFFVAYMAWAFNRIANFIEPASLASTTGEIAMGRARDLIGEVEKVGRTRAPEFVRDAESDVIRAVPDFRVLLETQVRTRIGQLVKIALAESDRVLVEELDRIPDAPKLMNAAIKDPDAAAKLYGEVRKAVINRPDVRASLAETMVELNKLRDRMRKMKDNRNLTPSERAERHLLQLVLAKVDLPPITAASFTAPRDAKHK